MQFSYTAQEAYDAAVNVYEAQLEKNRLELDSLIKHAVENGEFSVVYDRELTKNNFENTTKSILNQLGYKVTEREGNDRKVWIVSWEKPGVIGDTDEDSAP